jgi:hypothetical protein
MRAFIAPATLACTMFLAYTAEATDFTLSNSAILALDDNEQFYYGSPLTASIVSRQETLGTGIQYKIQFTSTNWPDYIFYQLSDKYAGAGTLVGMNVTAYSNFDLKFSLVSVDGSSSGSQVLEVGSMIGPYDSYWSAYHPVLTSLTGYYPPSAVSTISVTSATVDLIGFVVLVYPYGGWSAGPHDVTILVQPAPGAMQIPEPSTWTMLVLGVVVFRFSRRRRR